MYFIQGNQHSVIPTRDGARWFPFVYWEQQYIAMVLSQVKLILHLCRKQNHLPTHRT